MENSNELNLGHWVSNQISSLEPDFPWQPNISRALAQFERRQSVARDLPRRIVWVTAAIALVFLSVAMFPAPRVLAHRCIDCSVALWQDLSASTPVGAHLKPQSARKPAPGFSLIDASGTLVDLADLKGHVVLLNFWATWCGGCQVEIPWFVEFQNKYKNSGLAVVGISTDEDGWKSVRPYLKEKNLDYTIAIDDAKVSKLYGLDSMPMTLLIDRDGKIAATHVGLVTKAQYQAELQALLSQSVSSSRPLRP